MRMIGLMLFIVACGDTENSTETPDKSAEKAPAAEPAKAEKSASAAKSHGDMAHGKAGAVVADPGAIPADAKIFFVEPADGATVKSPVKVKMGIEGMKVQPAGEIVEGTGHHHIVIDAAPVVKGTMVPTDDQHKHFGKGQTETELTLAPGEHKLQLQFANGAHLSYGPRLNTEITITVEE